MKNLRVANRYAKALLGLAQEQGLSEEAYADMKLVFDVFTQSKELIVVLKSPIVRESKKQNILSGIFEGKVHPVTMHYLSIIARKKRASLILGIAHEYLKIHKEAQNIETVTVTTAKGLTPELRQKVMAVAATLTPKNIDFHEKLDPELIGGFLLNLGDLQYDASVKNKLSKLKKNLAG